MVLTCLSGGDVESFQVEDVSPDLTVVEVVTDGEVLITAHLNKAQRKSLIEALLEEDEYVTRG